jgi:hypothetical protein
VLPYYCIILLLAALEVFRHERPVRILQVLCRDPSVLLPNQKINNHRNPTTMALENPMAKKPKAAEGDKQLLLVIRHGDRFDYSHPEVGSVLLLSQGVSFIRAGNHCVALCFKTQLCFTLLGTFSFCSG